MAFLLAATMSWMACSTPSSNSFFVSVYTSNITETSAHCSISVSASDMGIIAESGVCYSSYYSSPTVSDNAVLLGYGSGSFESEINDLDPGTTFYIRAYAKTNAGIVYSDEQSFTTESKRTYLYYGPGTYLNSWGYTNGGDDEWGVMFPSSILRQYAGKYISKVATYIRVTGDYKLTLYTGGTSSPTSTLATRYYQIESAGWWDLLLPSPLSLNTSTSLWATLSLSYEKGNYPRTCSEGVNNPNARWTQYGGSWRNVVYNSNNEEKDLCWLIQVVLTDIDTRSGEEVILSWDGPVTEEPVVPVEPEFLLPVPDVESIQDHRSSKQ
jgi:hypothetical protein